MKIFGSFIFLVVGMTLLYLFYIEEPLIVQFTDSFDKNGVVNDRTTLIEDYEVLKIDIEKIRKYVEDEKLEIKGNQIEIN